MVAHRADLVSGRNQQMLQSKKPGVGGGGMGTSIVVTVLVTAWAAGAAC